MALNSQSERWLKSTRRSILKGTAAIAVTGFTGARFLSPQAGAETLNSDIAVAPFALATPMTGLDQNTIVEIVNNAMQSYDLRSTIIRVLVGEDEIITQAFGESMTGQPATTDMHFRNGAVAFSYISTLMLLLAEDGLISIDEPIARWLPDLPDAELVTAKMLANMTAGYPDYVQNENLITDLLQDPFRQYSPEELIEIGLSTPRVFAPGANWDYSHTNYVILGQLMETAANQPMDQLMQERVLGPLGLSNTTHSFTASIPEPALHAFSSERRQTLGIDPSVRFYEESTFWNPSWTTAAGAVQTTNIYDLAASAIAIGKGTLLSPESRDAMLSPELLGFGSPLDDCPACHTLTEQFNYGLGIVLHNGWLIQNPLYFGYSGVMAYHPPTETTIAVANTYSEASFDPQTGDYANGNVSSLIVDEIAKLVVPDVATPETTA